MARYDPLLGEMRSNVAQQEEHIQTLLEHTAKARGGQPLYQFEYRVDASIPNDIRLYIGDVLLGTGVLDGCELSYRSSSFSDTRDSYTVRWGLRGDAVIALGSGTACNAGGGWVGTEIIEVSSSNDPEVSPGCAYELSVEGTFSREVQ